MVMHWTTGLYPNKWFKSSQKCKVSFLLFFVSPKQTEINFLISSLFLFLHLKIYYYSYNQLIERLLRIQPETCARIIVDCVNKEKINNKLRKVILPLNFLVYVCSVLGLFSANIGVHILPKKHSTVLNNADTLISICFSILFVCCSCCCCFGCCFFFSSLNTKKKKIKIFLFQFDVI